MGSYRHRKRVAAKVAAKAIVFRDPQETLPPTTLIAAPNAEAALDLALEALARKLRPWIQGAS